MSKRQRKAIRGITVVALVAAALSAGAGTAHALVVQERTDDLAYFEGDGCGATDTARVTLPRGARRIEPLAPRVGQGIEDLEDESIVARISSIERLRLGGRVAFRYTAVGSDAACAEEAATSGWSSEGVELAIRYRRRVRVYMAGTDDRNRVRPRIITSARVSGSTGFAGALGMGASRAGAGSSRSTTASRTAPRGG